MLNSSSGEIVGLGLSNWNGKPKFIVKQVKHRFRLN